MNEPEPTGAYGEAFDKFLNAIQPPIRSNKTMTTQEIRDAIGPLNEASSLPAPERKLVQILHALNDRIEELMKRQATFEEETRFMVSNL